MATVASPPAQAANGRAGPSTSTSTSAEHASLVDLLLSTPPSQPSSSSSSAEHLTSLLSTPSTSTYLRHLSSQPLSSLQSEPSALSDESALIDTELTNLCHREYQTFLSADTCASGVTTAFASFESALDGLLSAVPALEDACVSFASSTRAIQAERRRAALVLEQHDKLLDVLELPQLIDTCVRNGYYQEALELSAHSAALAQRFADVLIVQDVDAEVRESMRLMVGQLLALLREPAKLPTFVKAIAFLRRMGELDEPELRTAFLSARLEHFRGRVSAIEPERADPVRYVRRYLDLFREHVFDIISQYTTIFLDSCPSPASHGQPLLIEFAVDVMAELLGVMHEHVPRIDDTAALASLLTATGYCASSFARVGLDFRALVAAPFEEAVLRSTTKAFNDGAEALVSQLADNAARTRPPAAWALPPDTLARILASPLPPPSYPQTAAIHTPPQALTDFPPLALLTNTLVNALNALRLLAPLALRTRLASALDAALARAARQLTAYARAVIADAPRRRSWEYPAEGAEERRRETVQSTVRFAAAFARLVVPFVREGLARGVFAAEKAGEMAPELGGAVRELEGWIESRAEKTEVEKEAEKEAEKAVVNGMEEAKDNAANDTGEQVEADACAEVQDPAPPPAPSNAEPQPAADEAPSTAAAAEPDGAKGRTSSDSVS